MQAPWVVRISNDRSCSRLKIQCSDAMLAMVDLGLLNSFLTRLRRCLLWVVPLFMVALGSPLATMASTAGQEVVVFRSAACECCRAWESHLTEAGFSVQDHVADDMNAIKDAMRLPADSTSCHTASLAGYVVEGHVPAASIERMLAERPEIKGLAAPGMPLGSPGMEVESMASDAFAVFSIADDGTMAEFDFYESE